jgi:alpha-tubulin suppressor-like RCC1 family protein
LNNVADITAGLDYTCAIMTYGRVMCWGGNDQGQLADGTRTDRLIPTLATLISGLSNVDAGLNKSCGLTSAGLLKCMSSAGTQNIGGPTAGTGQSPETSLDVAVNRFSSLIMALNEEGIPVEFQNGKFKEIKDVSNALDVDGGLGHVCTLLNNGTVKCWGANYYGQLGINSKVSSQSPQLVQGVSGAWQLAVGKYHACVLITSSVPGLNDIQCWGLNRDGQLGNGTNVDSLVPVFVK